MTIASLIGYKQEMPKQSVNPNDSSLADINLIFSFFSYLKYDFGCLQKTFFSWHAKGKAI